MRTLSILTGVLLCASMLASAGTGAVYRWKDPNGIWHYSDQPRPGAIMISGPKKPASAPNATPTPPPPPVPVPARATAEEEPQVSPEVANDVRAAAATAKTEQCKKATEVYDKSIQARRLYKTDEQGNRVYLSEAELDKERLKARSARDISCK